jgi:hypothetical protein
MLTLISSEMSASFRHCTPLQSDDGTLDVELEQWPPLRMAVTCGRWDRSPSRPLTRLRLA